MQNRLTSASRAGIIAGCACALLLLSAQGQARSHEGDVKQEFHQTYPLAANGRVEIENINGGVHITGWDRNEVKVDAVKYAGTQKRLDEAQLKIDAASDRISIRTEYPNHRTLNFRDDDRDNPASVEYTLTVPRSARLDEIKLVNGSLDVQGVSGDVDASCVNGRLTARDLSGPVKLNTVNGKLDAQFEKLGPSRIRLGSVNGHLVATLPSDANAEVEADTVSGGIQNDFGLHVINHRYIGHSLRGQLGAGEARIHLSNVNGGIEIRHAGDSRPLSAVKDLESDRDSRDRDRDRDEDDD